MGVFASKILSTVNAPYGANVTAHQLAAGISSIDAANAFMGPVFSFFSEVDPELQDAFIEEMGLPEENVRAVAGHLQAFCPFPLALAA